MSRTPVRIPIVILIAALSLSGLPLNAATDAPSGEPSGSPEMPPPIGVEEIAPGMEGYGLSVFRGARIDTFTVRVVGVQRGTRVDGDVILVEIGGQDLELARVVQGMSGSPIFLDGRFAGALAFGWSGSLRPIAGVTPAAEMLRLPRIVPEGPSRAQRGTRFAPRDLLADPNVRTARELGRRLGYRDVPAPVDFAPDLAADWPDPLDVLPSLVPGIFGAGDGGSKTGGWLVSRIGQGPRPAAKATLGAIPGDADLSLAPGAACAVPLVMGDAQLGAIGTVTWVQGDRVLLMGHPFLQRGPLDLPLATAEIATVLPAREMSFKMGSIGSVVGAVHHDQRAGLSGRLGAEAPRVPVRVSIRTATPGQDGLQNGSHGSRDYGFDVADDIQLTPSLVFWCLYNSLLAEGDDASLQTVNYRLVSEWAGDDGLEAEPLVLEGAASGPAGVRGLAAQWMAPLSLLLNNPFARLSLQEVRAELEVDRAVQTARIVSLTGPVSGLRAGEDARFRVELEPRRDAPLWVDFDLRVPDHLRVGPLRLVAASEAELFGLEAQRASGLFQVDSLEDAVDLLRTPRSPSRLVLALLAPGRGLVLDGDEWRELPGSMRRFLSESRSDATRTLADYVWREARPTDWILQGHALLELDLHPEPAPRSDERRP